MVISVFRNHEEVKYPYGYCSKQRFQLCGQLFEVYTKVVRRVTADELMAHIKKHTRKEPIYYTDTFRSYNSLRCWSKHHRLNHGKTFARRGKNHINDIEGFWSFAKHILYNYRGVYKYHFPMYLKEVEYRFNHRKENLFKRFLDIYFDYVSY